MSELYVKILLKSLGESVPIEDYHEKLKTKFDNTVDAVEIFESYIDEEVDSAFLCANNLSPLVSNWALFEYKDGHTFFVYPIDLHSTGAEYTIFNEEDEKQIHVDKRIFGLKITMRALEKLAATKWYANPEHSKAQLILDKKAHDKRVALYNDYHKNLVAMTQNIMNNMRREVSEFSLSTEKKIIETIKRINKNSDD